MGTPLSKQRHPIHRACRRLDAERVAIDNNQGVPALLFAREDVHFEKEGVEQLLGFIALQDTLDTLDSLERAGRLRAPFWGGEAGRLERVVLTPDFHRGSGIPVGTVASARGFVLPQAVGSDVCCGMRLLSTDLDASAIEGAAPAIEARLRGVFFEGQRQIPMSPRQREALLREGLWGLHDTHGDNAASGLWRLYDPERQGEELRRVHFQGVLPARGVFGFGDYVQASGAQDGRDSQIGSVGGGNHFVEIQAVEAIEDGAAARAWGVREGAVVIMAHSGSVGLGHFVGGHFVDRARAIYPEGLAHPAHGFYALPTAGPHAALAADYLDAMANAANFAFANRLMLGLMVIQALGDVLGRAVEASLIYDAPHNLIWPDGPGAWLHRKGACPAYGPDPGITGPFQYTGQPVIVPGSMGSSSHLMAGQGAAEALCSACHGAGRQISRGGARSRGEEAVEAELSGLRVVTAVDPGDAALRRRTDILEKHRQRLMEEAPGAYKPIGPVVQTIADAGVARPVARMRPLMTIKG